MPLQYLYPEAWPGSAFEISDGKIDTKYDRTKNTNLRYGGNVGNGQVDDSDVETVDLPGYMALQGFVP